MVYTYRESKGESLPRETKVVEIQSIGGKPMTDKYGKEVPNEFIMLNFVLPNKVKYTDSEGVEKETNEKIQVWGPTQGAPVVMASLPPVISKIDEKTANGESVKVKAQFYKSKTDGQKRASIYDLKKWELA